MSLKAALKMRLPFHIYCEARAVRLFELDDGRFQLIEQGPIAPLMSGYKYLLVETALAHFLQQQEIERVEFEPVVLFNRGTGDEQKSHVRLRVGQYFTTDQIRDLSLDGPRLLTMNDEYFFVSPELKKRLEASAFKYLRFSEGLTGFGCSAA